MLRAEGWQVSLDEEGAKAAAGELGYREAGALELMKKVEADQLRLMRLQLGLL